MGKFMSILGNAAAILYFLFVMWWVIFMLIFLPIVLMADIGIVRSSGYSIASPGATYIGMLGLFIGLSLLIPAFRKMYYKLPWMFPLVKISFLNLIIMSIADMLLNYGYEVQSPARQDLFFVIMICQIVISRVLMCVYFNKKKVQFIGGNANG